MTLPRALAIGCLIPLLWAGAVWLPGDHWAAQEPRAVRTARAQLAEGEPSDALETLDAAGIAIPGLGARLVAGNAALQLGELARAAVELGAARAIDGRSPHVRRSQCVLAGLQGVDDDGACGSAVALSGDMSICPALLARAFHAAAVGQATDAEIDLASCASLEPDHDGVARLTALVPGVEAGDEAARQRFVEAVLADPSRDGGDPRADAMEFVRELLGEDKSERALVELDGVERRWGRGAEVQLLRAQAQSQQGDIDRARITLVAVSSVLPAGSRLLLPACVLAADLEAHDSAESLCSGAAEASRSAPRCEALHALALSRLNRQQWASAEGAFTACLESKPDDASVWADAALAAAALGNVQGAIDRLRAAHALDSAAVQASSFDDEDAFVAFRADPRAQAALAELGAR